MSWGRVLLGSAALQGSDKVDAAAPVTWSLPPVLQVFPVPSQVRPLCSHPQGDPHRLPIDQPCQGQEEQTDGHGGVCLNPQPQQLLHQLRQLRGIVRRGPAQPQRAGKWLVPQTAASICCGLVLQTWEGWSFVPAAALGMQLFYFL